VGESLGPLARRLGAPDPAVLTAVFSQWEDLVGPAIAAHVRPLSLSGGALVIGADHPAWATQVRYLSGELLTRLATRVGAGPIERVEVKVVPPRQG
jgi:predicted nucleic acid-binding Zn ribbon protein